ncbi:serine/threonine-protein kinase par-1 [Aplysia californica]|uniref:Serine/threonine-protein kinase par-1 n=1 Tax=Aplysia californica TaxID=6500 RepID=A0ABM0JD91_APLCA|nr:serine/threonine-protein kinase par-1 [Aplysia californica]
MGGATPMQVSAYLHARGYRLGPRLGKGSYAKVKVAERLADRHIVAVKIVNRRRAAKEFLDKFLPRELSILLSLDHRNIIKVHEIIQLEEVVCVVMEYAGAGDLLDFVKRRGALAETQAGPIFAQVCEGIRYLHSRHICHRDLKCENILLRLDLTVALSDFGFSRTLPSPDTLSQTYCGSAAYASPELLRGKPYFPLLNDIWSLGCVLFIMVTGQMPFYDKNTKKMMYRQLKGKVNFPEDRPVTPQCRDVIGHTLEPNMDKRYDIGEILEHPWMAPYVRTLDHTSEDTPERGEQSYEFANNRVASGFKPPEYETGVGKTHPLSGISALQEQSYERAEHGVSPDNVHRDVRHSDAGNPDTEHPDTGNAEIGVVDDPNPRQSSRLSYSSVDSEEDHTTSGTAEIRSLCRMPGEACILRGLGHKSHALSRIEDMGSETDQTSPGHGGVCYVIQSQASSSSVDSAASYAVSSSTSIDPAPATTSPRPLLQEEKPYGLKAVQQRDAGGSRGVANRTAERGGLDQNFKMNIQKILQIPLKASARLLSPEMINHVVSKGTSPPHIDKSRGGCMANTTGAPHVLSDPPVGYMPQNSSSALPTMGGISTLAQSPLSPSATTNSRCSGQPKINGGTIAHLSINSANQNGISLQHPVPKNQNQAVRCLHERLPSSPRPVDQSESYTTSQSPPRTKNQPIEYAANTQDSRTSKTKEDLAISEESIRVHEEGLVTQMRRIFESKDASTAMSQRRTGTWGRS